MGNPEVRGAPVRTERRSSQVHGDQAGRNGGTKKVKEENGPLDDLDQNEDVRGVCDSL